MSDPKVIIFRGLPGSGKTTNARTLQKHVGGVLVGRDHLRFAYYGTYHDPDVVDEQFITEMQEIAIVKAIDNKQNVYVDDMNLRNAYVKRLVQLTQKLNVEHVIVDLTDVDVNDLVLRDAVREKKVGEELIRDLHKRFVAGKPYPLPINVSDATVEREVKTRKPYTHTEGLPWAILVDIDGTLAHMHNRSPYDETKVLDDDLDESVAYAVNGIWQRGGVDVILMSGRTDACREDTEAWLRKHGVCYNALYMRRSVEDKGRKDSEVKLDLFDEHIRGAYNIMFVLDDRNQVVEAWRGIGLKVFQVQEGDF